MTTTLFVCVDVEHCKVKWTRGTQTLTIHEGKWAVCPAGSPDGHTWSAVNGLDYEDLFRKRVIEKRKTLSPHT